MKFIGVKVNLIVGAKQKNKRSERYKHFPALFCLDFLKECNYYLSLCDRKQEKELSVDSFIHYIHLKWSLNSVLCETNFRYLK